MYEISLTFIVAMVNSPGIKHFMQLIKHIFFSIINETQQILDGQQFYLFTLS